MISKTIQRFFSLSAETKSMVFLYWVYEFGQMLTQIFLNAFIFLQTQSLLSLIIYNSIFFTTCFFGFVIWGYLVSFFQISMRWNYFRAFALYFIAFLSLLIFPHTQLFLYLFGALYGLGFGMFWLGVHSYEMLHTEDINRDFYSSMTSFGSQFFTILSPLFATITFLVSESFLGMESFYLLFWIMPFLYLSTLPFLFSLPDYIPPKIPKKDIKRLFSFSDKIIKTASLYYFIGNSGFALRLTLIPILALFALGNVVNIGILETLMGIASLFAVLVLSHVRHEGNRLSLLFYASIGFCIAYAFLFFSYINIYAYIAYSLFTVFLQPIYRVSEHVIDLRSVEIIQGDTSSFYPGLLYRDLVIWIGRIFALFLLACAAFFFEDVNISLQFGVVLLGLYMLLTWWSAKKLLDA